MEYPQVQRVWSRSLPLNSVEIMLTFLRILIVPSLILSITSAHAQQRFGYFSRVKLTSIPRQFTERRIRSAITISPAGERVVFDTPELHLLAGLELLKDLPQAYLASALRLDERSCLAVEALKDDYENELVDIFHGESRSPEAQEALLADVNLQYVGRVRELIGEASYRQATQARARCQLWCAPVDTVLNGGVGGIGPLPKAEWESALERLSELSAWLDAEITKAIHETSSRTLEVLSRKQREMLRVKLGAPLAAGVPSLWMAYRALCSDERLLDLPRRNLAPTNFDVTPWGLTGDFGIFATRYHRPTVSYTTVEFLRDRRVFTDLEVIGLQHEAFITLWSDLQRRRQNIDLERGTKDDVEAMEDQIDERATAVLVAHQKNRLQQLQLQYRIARFGLPAILKFDLGEELGIDPRQRVRLDEKARDGCQEMLAAATAIERSAIARLLRCRSSGDARALRMAVGEDFFEGREFPAIDLLGHSLATAIPSARGD